MDWRKFRFVSLMVLVGLCGDTSVAQPKAAVTMDKVMTPADIAATGLDTLSASQRSALDEWLVGYTLRVLESANRRLYPNGTASLPKSSNVYAGSSRDHWIQSNAMAGELIVLEDGSTWEVNPIDRIYTGLWLPISNITILEAGTPIGDFRYVLVNTDDAEKAFAKYVGQK